MSISFNSPKQKRDTPGYMEAGVIGPAPAPHSPNTNVLRFSSQSKRPVQSFQPTNRLTLVPVVAQSIPPGVALSSSQATKTTHVGDRFQESNRLPLFPVPVIPPGLGLSSLLTSSRKSLGYAFQEPNLLPLHSAPGPIPLPLIHLSQTASAPRKIGFTQVTITQNYLARGYPIPTPGTSTIPHTVGFLVNVGFLGLRR